MAINYERIGFNIKQCRKNAGLTQRVLAEKVGCTPEHFSHIEKGSRKVQLEMLVAICKHLNVSIEDVLENVLTVEIRRKDGNDDLSDEIQNTAFRQMLRGMSKEKATALMSICQSMEWRKLAAKLSSRKDIAIVLMLSVAFLRRKVLF